MSKIETVVDTWLTQPEANAAGRLGLFRIIYAMVYFFLASRSVASFVELSATPANSWYPTPLLIWMSGPPSAEVLGILLVIKTTALVLLGIGWRVRWMTFIVLITGILMGMFRTSVGGHIDHSKVFHEIYIPFMMLFAPWGATFSLDAVLRRRRGETTPDPSDDSLQFSWVFKALLWLLALMFMISGIIKAFPPGQWLTDLDLLRKIMLDHNRGPQDYLRYVVATLPLVPLVLQMMGLGFETLYPLVVINNTWRRFVLSSSVFFHLITKLIMNIWFWQMLMMYMFFFDIYSVYRRFFPHKLLQPVSQALSLIPSWGLIVLTWAIAIVALFARNTGEVWQVVGGTLNQIVFDEIWIVAGVLATYGIITSLIRLYRNLRQGRLFAIDA